MCIRDRWSSPVHKAYLYLYISVDDVTLLVYRCMHGLVPWYLYHSPIIRFIVVHFSLSLFFIHLCVQFCSYMCIILFCLLHVLILCIVYLCILCIRRSSLWLLYTSTNVCVWLHSARRRFQPAPSPVVVFLAANDPTTNLSIYSKQIYAVDPTHTAVHCRRSCLYGGWKPPSGTVCHPSSPQLQLNTCCFSEPPQTWLKTYTFPDHFSHNCFLQFCTPCLAV